MRVKKVKKLEKLPLWSWVFFGLGALALLLWIIAMISEGFSNAFNATVGAFSRTVLAHMTSWLPFSLAEIVLYCVPLILVVVGVIGYRRYCETWRETFLYLLCILSAFSLLFTVFVFSFGTGYHTTTLDKRLNIPAVPVNVQSLQDTAQKLLDELDELCEHIEYGEDGFSVMPYDLEEMNERLLKAYEPVCKQYPFVQSLNSRLKPVLASRAMSYTHITGVYSYFTGEANLNVHFPDYTLPFTAAHELAHQRGIARENEANFIAFLVCEASQDDYIRYSGYFNMLEYVLNALYMTDAEVYLETLKSLDERLLNELRAYSAFFDTFRDSVASNISDAVNDTYLKLNGNEAGTASYGLVVELAVAYFS